MAQKNHLYYVCSECGALSNKWSGQCNQCLAWNTLNEQAQPTNDKSGGIRLAPQSMKSAVQLRDISAQSIERLTTGNSEFDRVLGGGLVNGGMVLLGGDPGIGKSTLLLQVLAAISKKNIDVLYVSAEESAEQLALAAQRLRIQETALPVLAESDLATISQVIHQSQPKVVVIDSIQTVQLSTVNAMAGSVSQVRACAQQLTYTAKQQNTTVILVGHVTKEGTLAGPRVLEHIVDTVLYFEGEHHSRYRLIRTFKNRFGSVNEIGVFAMTDEGLKGVSNPSALFLTAHDHHPPGSAILITQEGSRPLLVEVQALVIESHGQMVRRNTIGSDPGRLAMLIAVLTRHCAIACYDRDVFINIVGGVRVLEPAADLSVICALVSSIRGIALERTTAMFGEVGLVGEIRPAPRGIERINEAIKLGFKRIILPYSNRPKHPPPHVELLLVKHINEALTHLGLN